MQLNRLTVFLIVIAAILLLVGSCLILWSLLDTNQKQVLFSDSFTILENQSENRTVLLYTTGDYVTSFTVSNGIIKFYPFTDSTLELWQKGTYEPQWVEAKNYDFQAGISFETTLQEGMPYHLVFINTDSYSKQVSLEVARVWNGLNYLNLSEGVALIFLGMSIWLIITIKNRKGC